MAWVSKFGWGALLLGISSLLPAQSVVINEYPIPPGAYLGHPWAIAAGPDGALWFTAANIGRITTAGTITWFVLSGDPTPLAKGTTAGPDGALWFTDYMGGMIGRITTNGISTEYSFFSGGPCFSYPGPGSGTCPVGITAGPDGALWFTTVAQIGQCSGIGRITTAGFGDTSCYQMPLPVSTNPEGITTGPDGAIWFTEYTGKIGRITTSGALTEYPVNGSPSGITAGPDGALWFTDPAGNGIGRITTSGISTEYAIPTPNSGPSGITAGPDGAIWFTESASNKIGRITTAGVITEFPIPTADSDPQGITTGPDGALWFTESGSYKIGQVVLTPPTPPSVSCTATPNTLWPPNGGSVPVTVSGTVTAGTSALAPGGTGYTVSDEYGQFQPSGSIALGAGGSYSFAVSLIAARNGNDKDGRTYTIVVNSQDISGKVGSCSSLVTVPHDQGN
jgi:virginiamycin B lyase